jgi:hypothetical protein
LAAPSSFPAADPAAAAAVEVVSLAAASVVAAAAVAAAADQAVLLGGHPRTHAWSLELLLWRLHLCGLMSAAASAS